MRSLIAEVVEDAARGEVRLSHLSVLARANPGDFAGVTTEEYLLLTEYLVRALKSVSDPATDVASGLTAQMEECVWPLPVPQWLAVRDTVYGFIVEAANALAGGGLARYRQRPVPPVPQALTPLPTEAFLAPNLHSLLIDQADQFLSNRQIRLILAMVAQVAAIGLLRVAQEMGHDDLDDRVLIAMTSRFATALRPQPEAPQGLMAHIPEETILGLRRFRNTMRRRLRSAIRRTAVESGLPPETSIVDPEIAYATAVIEVYLTAAEVIPGNASEIVVALERSISEPSGPSPMMWDRAMSDVSDFVFWDDSDGWPARFADVDLWVREFVLSCLSSRRMEGLTSLAARERVVIHGGGKDSPSYAVVLPRVRYAPGMRDDAVKAAALRKAWDSYPALTWALLASPMLGEGHLEARMISVQSIVSSRIGRAGRQNARRLQGLLLDASAAAGAAGVLEASGIFPVPGAAAASIALVSVLAQGLSHMRTGRPFR